MRQIEIRNEELLGILNEYPKLKDMEGFQENVHLVAGSHKNEREHYVGDNFRCKIMGDGTKHDVYPDQCVGYDFRLNSKGHEIFERNSRAEWRTNFLSVISSLNDKMMNFLSVRNNALACLYPPGGYIAWHNNANAPGYNFIFSWSETGDGWFKYVDPNNQQVVTVQDKPGWQLKAGYFGHYGEREKLLYHAASTDCWRCTVSYVFSHEDAAEDFREEIIEEISS